MEHRGCSVVHHRDHTKTPHLKKGVVKYRFSKKEKDSTKAYGAKIDSKRSHVLMDLQWSILPHRNCSHSLAPASACLHSRTQHPRASARYHSKYLVAAWVCGSKSKCLIAH